MEKKNQKKKLVNLSDGKHEPPVEIDCPECDGVGSVSHNKPCGFCNGIGTVSSNKAKRRK